MRVFKCPACGHRMRLSGDRCGKCYSEKPIFRTAAPYKLMLYLLLLGLGVTVFIRTIGHFR